MNLGRIHSVQAAPERGVDAASPFQMQLGVSVVGQFNIGKVIGDALFEARRHSPD